MYFILKNIEEEINDFMDTWSLDNHVEFMYALIELYKLYDVDVDDDWLAKLVGADDTRNTRLLRTVYLMSKMADFHAGKLCMLNVKYKGLWKRMEKKLIEGELNG